MDRRSGQPRFRLATPAAVALAFALLLSLALGAVAIVFLRGLCWACGG